jgi:hypothetical protein
MLKRVSSSNHLPDQTFHVPVAARNWFGDLEYLD